jgi:hypothetical protein
MAINNGGLLLAREVAMPAKGGGRRAKQREQDAGNLREVVLSVAMSLDGYIARRDGRVDWLIMEKGIGVKSGRKRFA